MGVGKTSYALWVAYELLGDWGVVLDHLFFKPEDAIRAIAAAARRGEKLPIIIMDDAGTWLDRLTWWESGKVSFMKFFNLIRSVAHSVVFTTPTEELPKQIINKCFIRVNVRRTGYDELREIYGGDLSGLLKTAEEHGLSPTFSLAVGYVVKTLPSFMQLVRKEFYDAFPTHYPRPVFERYERIRRKAVGILLGDWEAEHRRSVLSRAVELLNKGVPRSEVVKYLTLHGFSRASAYRWVKRYEETVAGAKGQGEQAALDTLDTQ